MAGTASPLPKGAGKGMRTGELLVKASPTSPYRSPFLTETHAPSREAIKNIPLELLFGCASLAKKYEIPGFVSMMLAKIKPRLRVDNFDQIMH